VKPGAAFPDLDLPDHTGRPRLLSDAWWIPMLGDTLVRTDLFSRVNPPPGPPIERYAGAPWPGGAFDVL
jgi:hypothetical protein